MFKPMFSKNLKMTQLINKIEETQRKIEAIPMTPAMQKHLRDEARIDSVYYSCKISGNRLSRDEVAQVIKGIHSQSLRSMDARQRIVSQLFEKEKNITSLDVAQVLGIGERTARGLCLQWVQQGFFILADPAKRSRKYGLAPEFDMY